MQRVLSESQIERKLKKEIERRGGLALKFVSPGWRGAPDRIVFMPWGRIAFVEVKAEGQKARPLQTHRLRQLRALGFDAITVTGESGLNKFLRELDKRGV